MRLRPRNRRIGSAVSRREFLERAGILTGALALGPSILAACGGDDDDDASSSATSGGGGSSGKVVKISSWTGYMTDQSLKDFRATTGIDVDYDEDINDNNEYFAKIRPNLSQGKGTGRDGMVLTDWMVNRLINQVDPPWVLPFVAADFPNKANLLPALQSPDFDPSRKYSVPWATGMTGIAYNIGTTGKEIRTIDEFLAAPGTKTVLTEMRDTVGLFMAASGADPSTPTVENSEPAFDALQKAVDDGTIDGFNGNEYVNDLGAGNLAAAFAWSGDVAQITRDNPDVRFAIPDSGGMLWSDNFVIPLGTDHADLATQWINFFYDPKNAAVLTAGTEFVYPVVGVADQLTAMGGDAAALVDNPLVVPTDEFLKQLHVFGTLDADAEETFDKKFSEILGAG
jgi:spermidine/putrescine transport system substrate-binding protein